ncbi:FAD-binding oxidoreductase [Vacuolonema iberomarrocanum]|uniref:FAD-binding oxidoreductase n=1 Tax=Vacuolonema iberomarrocanum TaxID=3454632 RepID=UPI0019EE6671|nr:FAD-binding oxidoreductase [filamentous cyanobacterium LEGE 07170]
MGAIASQIESIIGTAGITAWSELPAEQRQHYEGAIAPGTLPEYMICPDSQEALAEVVAWAHRDGISLLPCGSGSKLDWGKLTEGIQVILSTERLNRLVEHATGDMVVIAEAGLPFADLQAALAPTNQFLSLDPAYPERATLGGIVATADSGALRQRYGGVRDLLIGISFVRADGQVARGGGKVVKNVAGYDLMKLMTGAYGTLGVLSQLIFRTYPLPEAGATVVAVGDGEAIAQLTQSILLSSLTPTALELLAPVTTQSLGLESSASNNFGLLVRFQSIPASVEQQSASVRKQAESVGLATTLLQDAAEADLWKRLREKWDEPAHSDAITCKMGVRPTRAIELLSALEKLEDVQPTLATLHAGSGLGYLHLPADASPSILQQIRQLCETHSGYLTIQRAPVPLKQSFDIWGIRSETLPLMQGLKQRFDSQNLLSPGRML